ncbi:MAG: multifunctional 2-oxoglutarate metabolism enzyme, partial [Actinomycetota bacterium]|nr:multifunctional 2-oxoglutarate metabolism enzyme [Actinomycetota bacterium]
MAAFGPNEWLVDELYQQYLEDKNSVDEAWWEFFADYEPKMDGNSSSASTPTETSVSTDGQAGTSSDAGTSASASPSPSNNPAAGSDSGNGARQPPAAKSAAKSTESEPFTSPAASAPSAAPTPSAAPAETPAPPASTPAAKKEEAPRSAPKTREIPPVIPTGAPNEDVIEPLRGAAARTVTNMESSLTVPTATSVRAVPAKLLIDNRVVINNHLRRSRGGKVSYTHLIGFALIKALTLVPQMNKGFGEKDGKPAQITPAHINLGLAIDIAKPDGTRTLLVPAIKSTESMDFAHFWTAYEEVVRKARTNKLAVEDFKGITISLTNPGGIGTVHSVPRLMSGQGAIIGVGALEYPAEWQGASQETLNRNAVSKVITLTSTYDHRIIQGALSGEFLRVVHQLLLGEHNFYGEIFESLRIPYEPIAWIQDITASHDEDVNKTARVQELIHAYRVRGHLMADTDPLEYRQRHHPDLDVSTHGLTLWDLERDFPTGGFGGAPLMQLRKILGLLRDAYCRTTGIEYMHIQDPDQRKWIQSKIETPYAKTSAEEQLRILRRLNAAEAFETFLQTKFVGQKRFSLEGGESVIAVLDRILSRAAGEGMDEVCIGMSHRGRLNVLANIAGKSYEQIFREFEGTQDPKSVQGSGDVKYHLGTEGKFVSEDGDTTKVYLAANPSHLEAVNPVLEGIVRAKQDRLDLAGEAFTVLPVLLHGDAAFAGQGVVAETLNLSQLRGYRTGGTVHVVINNQVGFTTSPSASRSSVYSTDVARMIQAPIFHVNGDDPEACVRVAELAYEFRQAFNKDVVIDMICYRRRGHNEGDDPSMTQPMMYSLIEAKRSVRKLYTESLIGRGDITVEEAEGALRDYRQQLERAFVETKGAAKKAAEELAASGASDDAALDAARGNEAGTDTEGHGGLERPNAQEVDEQTPHPFMNTAISVDNLHQLGNAFLDQPEGFTIHPKLAQLMQKRADMVHQGGIDWAMAELLAFGSLLKEGI